MRQVCASGRVKSEKSHCFDVAWELRFSEWQKEIEPMALTGFLKFPDIDGESAAQDHVDEIDVFGVGWKIVQQGTTLGGGRAASRAEVGRLELQKFYDASSPYLASACASGKAFDEVTVSFRKDSGEAQLDYLVIRLSNVTISEYQMDNDGLDTQERKISEFIALSFEKVKVIYTVQADDHSAGDEHEVEFPTVP